MPEAALRFWATNEDLAPGPYPERTDRKTNWFDRTLTEARGTAASRLGSSLWRLRRTAGLAERYDDDMRKMTDQALRLEAERLRPRLLREGFQPHHVARSFALVREVSRRHLGLFHHPVQLNGGLAMLEGSLVEMATGEGKTITAMLTAATASLAGIPVHVVTVNDYLARRDAENLRPVYEALGQTVGLVEHGQEPHERRAAYGADVVYATNKELAFDYLKDRIALQGRRGVARMRLASFFRGGGDAGMDSGLVLRGLHFAIVDEADSVLIDEARTPLIISAENGDPDAEQLYPVALDVVAQLEEGRDYTILQNERTPRITAEGRRRVETLTKDMEGLWRIRRAREELAEQAISAAYLFERDRHYIVADGTVQIVDEYTGRVMPDRSWEGGLHQLIEAKEGCDLTGKRETLARITYQRFFGRYRRLAGMSGTALEVAGELRGQFDLKTVRIPTNRPLLRRFTGTRIYSSTAAKWRGVVERTLEVTHNQGRPVLIGTRSVEASEEVAERLTAAGIEHVVLNARQDEQEADIVAQAGEPGRVTVATNMAGRGTDIGLAEHVAKLGGLHVILTEFHESARIDRQLYGRAGRQGDPGSCEAIVCLDDELFQRFASRTTKKLTAMNGRSGRRLPGFIGNGLRYIAQNAAEKQNVQIRREQLKLDKQLFKALAFSGITE